MDWTILVILPFVAIEQQGYLETVLNYCALDLVMIEAWEPPFVDFAQRHHFTDVVIVADADVPGQRGARNLAIAIRLDSER